MNEVLRQLFFIATRPKVFTIFEASKSMWNVRSSKNWEKNSLGRYWHLISNWNDGVQHFTTGPFTILEPRDQEIGEFQLVRKRRLTDLKTLKLWKGWSGLGRFGRDDRTLMDKSDLKKTISPVYMYRRYLSHILIFYYPQIYEPFEQDHLCTALFVCLFVCPRVCMKGEAIISLLFLVWPFMHRSRIHISPTEHFAILEPANPPIDVC